MNRGRLPMANTLRAAAAKRHKYGAQRTTVDGETFDSKGEALRWCELKLLEKAGHIRKLRRQVVFPLAVPVPEGGGVLVASYRADFVYEEAQRTHPQREPHAWREVVEDFKGVRNEGYQLKKRLMLALYGVEIRETGRAPKARRAQLQRRKA